MQTDFRLPKLQVSVRKRKQTQTNANKRRIKELRALLRTPFFTVAQVVLPHLRVGKKFVRFCLL